MDREGIGLKIKQIIAEVTNLSPREIADEASFTDDLHLDSLSMLEIAGDVDYQFRLGVSEQRLQELRTVADAVALVLERRPSAAGSQVA